MTELESIREACAQRHRALDATIERICRLLENGNGLGSRMTRSEEHMKSIDENLERGSKQFAVIQAQLNRISTTMIVLALIAGGTVATKLIEAVITGKISP